LSAPGPDTMAIGLPEAVSQNDGKVSALGAPLGEQAGPSQEAQERLAEMPLPQNLQSLVLMGMFALLILFALYFTAEVVLPIIFAIILYLVLQPAMRGAARLRIPKAVAALLIIFVFFGGVGVLGFTLSGPAADWVSKAPESLRRIEQRLFVFKQPMADLQSVSKQVEKIAEGPPRPTASPSQWQAPASAVSCSAARASCW
jgi:predicted PurR-regulated permease PerM